MQMIAINNEGGKLIPHEKANAAFRSVTSWKSMNWEKHREIVKKLQLRIAKATRDKKYRKVQALQWLLTHSLSAKLIAVNKVMQNKGSKTPGVDNVIIRSPEEKLAMALSIRRRGYTPSALKRVYIPKAGNKNKTRPLGIPTITDRCQQALYSLALSPVAEITADQNSFGFRPHRCCADALVQIFIVLARNISPKWILEGDIKGCFDNINHQWMLNNIPLDKIIMEKWLKAGFISNGKLFPTEQGTPQGGLISPIMCNMVLDGMAKLLQNKFKSHKGIHFIRYADDFIVTGFSKEVLETAIKPAIADFLTERGLELSQEKTKITHINDGFDFLGQNVRKYKCKNKQKLLIKPSKNSIHTFLENIRKVFREARSMTHSWLIKLLNPKIRGWANYHRGAVSKKTFTKIDSVIWRLSYQWAKRKHPQKNNKWIIGKYFKSIGGRNFRFCTTKRLKNGELLDHPLLLMTYTPIRRHVKILKAAQPFDTQYDEYFEKRISEKWQNNTKRLSIERLVKTTQKGLCPCCSGKITGKRDWYISLKKKASIGGLYRATNMDIVHKKCYEQWQSTMKLHKCGRPAI